MHFFKINLLQAGGVFAFLCGHLAATFAQVQDTTATAAEEEDYSQYENASFTDASARRYCSPKVFDLSPQRFLSLAWDVQLPYDINFSAPGQFAADATTDVAETARAQYTGGLRLTANIPVVSRNSLIWQVGASYWDTRYRFSEIAEKPSAAGLAHQLEANGLRTMGLNTTVFKPIGETTFLIFQGSADLNGDYTFTKVQPLRYLRYSMAAIWGRRPHDRKQWGLGVSRTYRVGEMNYIPVFLFNYTAANRKWGTEILFPARAHIRRSISPRHLLLVGYELEGQSYRLRNLSPTTENWEIRRGEMRIRAEFQRKLVGFVWLTAQAGWRHDWSYHLDALDTGGSDFFRGFFGNQTYRMLNELGGAPYFNLGLHLVSP